MENLEGVVFKSDMDSNVNYVLCPDKDCKLFFASTKYMICEHECPKQDEKIIIVKCSFCDKLIELPGETSTLVTVSHSCKNGNTPTSFVRMSGKYQLIYEPPK